MPEEISIAVAGLGTVGAGALRLLQENAEIITARCGRRVKVAAVSARDRARDRGCDLADMAWYDDPVRMAREADAEVVVELIGGSEGPARATVEAALSAGRHVVTANKALLAHHGQALAEAADAAGRTIAYEAAVAGGIPVIKAIREGLAANRIRRLHGILNGTSNYILTTMRETGRGFDDVLAEAQSLGYAEADPSFDVDGVDAAHKLAILTSLAFGVRIDFDAIHMEGIRHVAPADIAYAEELGFRIKLLATAELRNGGVEQRVHPAMVPATAPIAAVEGVLNAVVTESDFAGPTVLEGRGAGAGPTASAVVADIVDIALGRVGPVFGVRADRLGSVPTLPVDRHVGAFYIRLTVIDRPGVIADVAAALRDESVSLESMIQRGRDPDMPVAVVLTTHETQEAPLRRALGRIAQLEAIAEPPRLIRIESFEEQ